MMGMTPKASIKTTKNAADLVPRTAMENVRAYSKNSGKRGTGEGLPPTDWVMVNSSSASQARWSRELSPMLLPAGDLYIGPDGRTLTSLTVEAAWQHSKVYPQHVGPDGEPAQEWWEWAQAAWGKGYEEYASQGKAALRYPMGKDPKTGKSPRPAYSYWAGMHLDYVTARRRIYIPLYTRAVTRTDAWRRLQEVYEAARASGSGLRLFDFDGFNLHAAHRTYAEALADTTRPFGHSLVLCALLEGVDLTAPDASGRGAAEEPADGERPPRRNAQANAPSPDPPQPTDRFTSYPIAQAAAFRQSKACWGGFSNMSEDYPLTVNGVAFQTSEALFQAMKFPHRPEAQQQIIAEKNPLKVAWIGRRWGNTPRADWKEVRVDVMRWAVRVKLAQHGERFGALLLETGERPIVENSARDAFWGAVPDADGAHLVGENQLGRLLMELRDELRDSPETLFHAAVPPPVPDFLLLGLPIEAVLRAGAPPPGSVSRDTPPPDGGFCVKQPLRTAGAGAVPADVPVPQRVYCGSAARLLAVSRPLAARLVLDEPYMVISLDSPGKEVPMIAESPLRVGVLRVIFNDIRRPRDGRVLFTRAHAREILDFVGAHLTEARAILVHCTHGVYRSPAVASALSTILQGEERFFKEMHSRNHYVYNTLLAEWRADPRPAPLPVSASAQACVGEEIGAEVVTVEDAPITSFKWRFAFLSNFCAAPVEYEGVTYPSVEHAYQAAKTLDCDWRTRIQQTGRPHWAKLMTRRKGFPMREEWDATKEGVMLSLLRQKFSEPRREAQLWSTGRRVLIEGNIWGDRYWGACQDDEGRWVGKNRLGEMLMELRGELFENEDLRPL